MVIGHRESMASALPGIEHTTLAGSAEGLEDLSVWKQRIAPGGETPMHRHDCEEVVLVSAGMGELRLETGVERFAAPCTVVVPRNAVHQLVNTGHAPLELIGVFGTAPVEVYLPDGEALLLPWVS